MLPEEEDHNLPQGKVDIKILLSYKEDEVFHHLHEEDKRVFSRIPDVGTTPFFPCNNPDSRNLFRPEMFHNSQHI